MAHQIKVTKAHGTQNHFLIIQSNKYSIYSQETIQKIVASSNIKRIDGMLILSNSDSSDFKMDYYNNDGTWETMCANGARCAALYMYQQKIIKNKIMQFEAGDGMHRAEIINSNYVKLQMSTPKYCSNEIRLLDSKGYHIDSGATHFVVEYPRIKDKIVKALGSKIRYNDIFSPRGINVNFYEVISPQNIIVKTYEKGIEDLMMSCGSGSVACAFHLSRMQKIISPLAVNVPGGDLKIEFNDSWQEVWLSGEAEIEQTITLEI